VDSAYYTDDYVQLFLGDCREVLPALGVTADCVVADPPYGETSLSWDRWPDGWLDAAAQITRSLWCFGSLRMFLDHRDEFAGWKLSQDVIWEKQNGSGFATDRFRRVHDHALHWYRGPWGGIHHEVPRLPNQGRDRGNRSIEPQSTNRFGHMGQLAVSAYVDDGLRLARSVIRACNLQRRAIHPAEKPLHVLTPLIEYACPGGGLVIDPFAGSGSTLDAARCSGRRAVGVEIDERYCELAARRLSQAPLITGSLS
jgi:site-specific DNA-methyltransferase (adenine-specific)